MNHAIKHFIPLGVAVSFAMGATVAWAQHQIDDQRISAAAGTKAAAKDGIVRIEWPRDDVPVKVDGMSLKPSVRRPLASSREDRAFLYRGPAVDSRLRIARGLKVGRRGD